MRRVVFLSSEAVWQRGHGPEHPLKPERLQRTHELLDAAGALAWPEVRVVPPRPASDKELTLFHTRAYVDAVRSLSQGDLTVPAARYNFGPGDNPIFPGMFHSEGLKVGSALQGAQMLLADECDVAFSYSGGLHHGGPNFASGFCVFNDAAVAISWLRQQRLRVAYIDVDVHHGDGVQDAFYDSDQVLTISLHQDPRTLFPGTGFVEESGQGAGRGYSVNVPLPPRTRDEAYLQAFRELVPPLIQRFRPDILVSQMGVDTHFRDPLANLALTIRGQETLFRELAALAPPCWLALGGGGYAVDVVPRSWALAFAIMCQRPLPRDLPAAYREKYGGSTFYDAQLPPELQQERPDLRRRVQQLISAVRNQHGLAD